MKLNRLLGFVWLMTSLCIGFFVFRNAPNWSPMFLFVIGCVVGAAYLFGVIVNRRNWLIGFFTMLLWWNMSFGLWSRGMWDAHALPVPSILILRICFIVSFTGSLIVTFMNYRAAQSFRMRRGNIDKEKLVATVPSFSERWNSIKRLFKRKSEEPEEIMLVLGEEIPMKE